MTNMENCAKIEEVNQGFIISVNGASLIVPSPVDAVNIINSLTSMLEEQHNTIWLQLQSTKDKRKLAELNIFLSMCKNKVDIEEMRKVME